MLARLTSAAVALALVSTTAEAAPLTVSNDPTLAYAILAAAAGIVVLLGIGAYNIQRRGH